MVDILNSLSLLAQILSRKNIIVIMLPKRFAETCRGQQSAWPSKVEDSSTTVPRKESDLGSWTLVGFWETYCTKPVARL